jgi:hypothetical protein
LRKIILHSDVKEADLEQLSDMLQRNNENNPVNR